MNKKLFLALVFFSIYFSATSQDKWSVGVAATNSITMVDFVHKPVTHENYGGGIRFSVFRKVTKRLYFSSGIYFTTRKYHKPITQSDPPKPDVVSKRVTSADFYGIPLLLNFRFPLSQKFSLTATTGFTLEWNKNMETTFYYPNQPARTYTGGIIAMRPTKIQSVFLGTGLGANYKLSDRFSLMATTFSMVDLNMANIDQLFSNELIVGVIYNLGPKKKANEYLNK